MSGDRSSHARRIAEQLAMYDDENEESDSDEDDDESDSEIEGPG